MAANISALLDKAKTIHRLPSDYKLAVVMGVKQTTLTNYRNGKTLPDARVIQLICELTGDDAALLAAEIEEQRANTDEARSLWHLVATRLQSTLHAAVLAVVLGAVGWGAFPSDAQAFTAVNSSIDNSIHRGMWRQHIGALFRRLVSPLVRYVRELFKGHHVSRTASIAAA